MVNVITGKAQRQEATEESYTFNTMRTTHPNSATSMTGTCIYIDTRSRQNVTHIERENSLFIP